MQFCTNELYISFEISISPNQAVIYIMGYLSNTCQTHP